MDSDSWFPCYPSDLISDTTRLRPHDFGAYWRLLCDYYQNGPLPDDDDDLRRITGVDPQDWARTKGKIMLFFNLEEDGRWHQKRADEVIAEREELAQRKRAQTAAARAKNPKNTVSVSVTDTVTDGISTNRPVTDTVTAVQPQPQPQPYIQPQVQPKRESVRFAPPTLEEVKLQAAKIGLPEDECDAFMAYYQSNGWRVGRNAMKCWASALTRWKITWEKDNHGKLNIHPTIKGDARGRTQPNYANGF